MSMYEIHINGTEAQIVKYIFMKHNIMTKILLHEPSLEVRKNIG